MREPEDYLQKYFGFSQFRVPQKEIVQSILHKQDTVALLPTGKGKSLCFQLPSVILPPTTVVISPLLALMHDQVEKLKNLGILAQALTSDISHNNRKEILTQLKKNTLQFLYLSPEQLDNPHTCNILLSSRITHLCVDEAHCISQWGHDFRPHYQRIPHFIEKYMQNNPRPVLSAFTATASQRVWKDIRHYYPLQTPQIFILPYYRSNLEYAVIPVDSEAQKRKMWFDLLSFWKENKLGKFLVYVSTRVDADFYAQWAQLRGFPAKAFHAGFSSTHRNKLLHHYQKSKTGILVATTAFGMGIDIPDIRIVVHLSPPTNLSAYAQESGRAGRDGKKSWCILLFRPEDLEKNYEFFLSNTISQRQHQQKETFTLHQWVSSSPCYAQKLTRYFDIQNTWKPINNICHCSRCFAKLLWKDEKQKAQITQEHFLQYNDLSR